MAIIIDNLFMNDSNRIFFVFVNLSYDRGDQTGNKKYLIFKRNIFIIFS